MLRQYRAEKVIGQGGFGITYLAYDTELQRNVAIKECYPRDFVARDGTTVVPTSSNNKKDYDWAIDKFMDEATTLAKFRHPGIVQVLQILKGENNSAYMVLEFVEGQSLDQWLKSLPGVPSQTQLEAIVEPMLDALSAVHKASFTHRDIAPDNIYIRKNGEAVLLDFGAAKLTASQYSKTMNLVVKDGYSAPEQYYAEGRQGSWTDIYAFAATLYRCLSGQKPVDAMARLDAINNSEPDPLKPLEDMGIEGYTPEFLAAINSGLSPQVKSRPQDVETWRKQLFAGREPSSRRQPVSPQANTDTPEQETTPPSKTRNKPKSGSRLFAVSAALALVVALGGGAYWFYLQQRAAAEDQAWVTAHALDTERGYERFTTNHPASQHVEDVREALLKLQSPWDIVLDENLPGQAFAVAANSDMIAVAGTLNKSDKTGQQAVVYNLSLSGHIRWKALFGDRGEASFRAVAMLPDGGLVAAGEAQTTNDGQLQGILVHFSPKGELVWSRQFGGPGLDRLNTIRRLDNGNLVAAGTSMKIRNGTARGWLLNISPKGELIQERTFQVESGGAFTSVAQAPGGGLVLAGATGQSDAALADFWIIKLSSDGSVLFDRKLGGKGRDQINSIAAGENGDFILVGETTSFGTKTNDGIGLYITADNKMPLKPFIRNNEDRLSSVAVGHDGQIYAVGETNSNSNQVIAPWILEISPGLGTITKEIILEGDQTNRAASIALLGDNSLVIAGTSSNATRASENIWVKRHPMSESEAMN